MRRHAKAIVAISALLLTLAMSATLASAVAPVVSVEDATNVSYTTADVKGTVNPEGQFTTWRFQYISDAQFQENLANSLPGFEGASTRFEGSTETEETLERQLIELKPGTTYHLRLVAENGDGQSEAVATNSFTTKVVGPPTVAIDPVTIFTGTTAKFTGTIDPEAPEEDPGEFPKAFDVEWRFDCTPSCPGLETNQAISADSDPHTVEAEAKGLEPNTTYEVTLIAENVGNLLSDGPESFKTSAVPPQVQTLYAGYLEAGSATLAANVNPRNSPATYQFEWGTDTSYGSLAPATPQALGAQDSAFHLVTAPVAGLQPDTTYHFRLIATNTDTSAVGQGVDHAFTTLGPQATGNLCPNANLRTGPSAKLPECRAYELVSPLDKAGGDVEIGGTSRAAEQGDAIAYMTFGSVDSALSRGYLNELHSERSAGGWVTKGVNPPMDPFTGLNTLPQTEGVSPDAAWTAAASWGSEEYGHPQMINLWRHNSADSSFQLLSDPTVSLFEPDVPPQISGGAHFVGASDDFSHVVFESQRQLTPEGGTLYEWAEGNLRSVAFLPEEEGGGVLPTAKLGYGNPTLLDPHFPGHFAVSRDGTYIYFSESGPGDAGRRIYRRGPDPETGEITTVQVSRSERTDCADDPTCGGDGLPDPAPDPTSTGAQFHAASADGSIALFSSQAKLTDDSTAEPVGGAGPAFGEDPCVAARCDLYRWNGNAPEGERLTDLTAGVSGGSGVLGIAGASEDASAVYFVAIGVLAAGGIDGDPNLYLWKQGSGFRFIGSLDQSLTFSGRASDEGIWSNFTGPGNESLGEQDHRFRGARVTSDGRYLLFRSSAQLTAYDNDDHLQVYRYDSFQDELLCASCNPRTEASTADARFQRQRDGGQRPPWLSRNISEDGSLVFFDTAEALVPADSNGRSDVYRWSEGGGAQLISFGQDARDSYFIDASTDATDVFIATQARLTGADIDNQRDIYDLRVGGGFPQPTPPPSCEGDSCQPPPILPDDPTPSSSGFAGPGSAALKKPRRRCAKGRTVRRGRCVRKRSKATKKRASDNRRASR